VRILTVVLRVCEYSELCVFVCVGPHVYGDDGCSCIYGELVCVIACGISVVMSRVEDHARDLGLSSILRIVSLGCVMLLLGRYVREVIE
jgi:hypothetical protein